MQVQTTAYKRKKKCKLTFKLIPKILKIVDNDMKIKQNTKARSSHSEVFCKKQVLKNFTKFAGKYLCRSLFFNNAGTSVLK